MLQLHKAVAYCTLTVDLQAGEPGPPPTPRASADRPPDEGKGQAIMSASHRSATRFPGAQQTGRGRETERRGGIHRRAP
jgi:hypothetical protein